jgi:predicted dehydrogenase
VDQQLLDKAAEGHPRANKYTDLRKLLEDKDVDAVAIATCNHWHVLAAIWACQAGKDVYVEKPLGHNHWEGQQLVKAARKHDRIVQVGTQQRSDDLQSELKEYLHKDKPLGEIKYVEVCRYGKREPIGKRSQPLAIPSSVDYNLWVGPAEDLPIYRDKLHYDWHWDWNTGNGEQGNWGVHVLDDAVNVVLQDKVPFPKRVLAAGGRMLWNDAGQTPNVTFVSYDTGSIPVIFGLSNLPARAGDKDALNFKGVGSGYVIQCEGGYYAGGRGGGAARDNSGQEIKRFRGDSGARHARNFVTAVLDRDRSKLNCEVQIGHQATAWCNLANVACRMGKPYTRESAEALNQKLPAWDELVEQFNKHLADNGVDLANSEFKVSPVLEFDAATEQFTGPSAAAANQFLRREYHRPEFAVPAIS